MPKKKRISPRKTGLQRRSRQMYEDILEAAIRVLETSGSSKFNTIKIAEKAGISVGSLYQYFPNKESIAFALQDREWQQTSKIIERNLSAPGSPQQCLEQALFDFFLSEWNERDLRQNLVEVSGAYKESNEFKSLQQRVQKKINLFLRNAFSLKADEAQFWTDYLIVTTDGLGEKISNHVRTKNEMIFWAKHVVPMLVRYISENAKRPL